MKVIDLGEPHNKYCGASCALGNFDGLHLGHYDVLKSAHALNQPFGIITFAPHPREYFNPDMPPFRLTPLPTQIRLAQDCGVDVMYIVPFNNITAHMTPEEFVEDIIVARAGVKKLSIGENFHFGAKRKGNSKTLTTLAARHDIPVTTVPLKELDNTPISSSVIRQALSKGNTQKAARLLGRWFEIEGIVQHGDKRGRTLGYPTLNIQLGHLVRPAFGVYAVQVFIENICYDGVASLGIRPMFALDMPQIEVHVFDFNKEIYGQSVRITLRKLLRPEQKFDNLDLLIDQMNIDSCQAKNILRTQKLPWIHTTKETQKSD